MDAWLQQHQQEIHGPTNLTHTHTCVHVLPRSWSVIVIRSVPNTSCRDHTRITPLCSWYRGRIIWCINVCVHVGILYVCMFMYLYVSFTNMSCRGHTRNTPGILYVCILMYLYVSFTNMSCRDHTRITPLCSWLQRPNNLRILAYISMYARGHIHVCASICICTYYLQTCPVETTRSVCP